MSRRKPREARALPPRGPAGFIPTRRLLVGFCALCLISAIALIFWSCHRTGSAISPANGAQAKTLEAPYVSRAPGTITFNKDIAPIVFNRCAPCHHPGQPAPFPLLSFHDVAKRAQQIVDVTQSGYMPPWLPEHGFGQFANERRLSSQEKGLIQQWAREGAPEGTSPSVPVPNFPEGWTLGSPDLVVAMPEDYVLGPEGGDVYRNFVIPVPLTEDRFVRALEFAPGNSRIVHHAFIKVDSRRASRSLDALDAEVGFPGMNVPAEMPNGQFLSWQPGKLPSIAPEGLSWLLPKNSDLVVQFHLNRSGKIEKLRSLIGLYFTNTAPAKACVKTSLMSLAIDIPAGDSNYVVTDAFTLPVDVQVLSILPHAHYLAKEIQSFALLPDGSKKRLLLIKHWDFKWQGDYQYVQPVFLPQGTTVNLRFTYDNSTNNPANPNLVPKRVSYGPQSTDEMCELWFQMVPDNPPAAAILKNSVNTHVQDVFRLAAEHRLALNPNDADAHTELAIQLFSAGKRDQALAHLTRAVGLDPTLDQPHLEMGVILRSQHRLAESKTELETALRLNPNNSKAYGHLGFVFADRGDAANAERCFAKCLQLDPADSLIQQALSELQQFRKAHPP